MCPAGSNNVVALKATTGLVSRDAIIPASYLWDTVGPFTRNVKDSAHILTQIAGRSHLDPRTEDIPFQIIPDFAKSCQGTNLHGVRIGVPRNAFPGLGPVETEAFTKALKVLAKARARIVENTDLIAAEKYTNSPASDKSMITHADFKVSIVKYIKPVQSNPNDLHTLQDLIVYTKTHDEDYPTRDVVQFENAQAIDTNIDAYRDVTAREERIAGDEGIPGAIERHNVDVLAVPQR